MKTEFRHTPGPWKIFYPTVDECGFGIDTADKQKSIVVMDTEAGIYSAETREEDLANAKLIAAAPDLLEALTYVQWWINVNNEGNNVNLDFDKINNAIKKATE
jgi:hypothetical protein